MRESVPEGCSQERLAEAMAVSPDTAAGWETGRRPLTAVRAGQFVMLRSALTRLGAVPYLARVLIVAMEADQILDHARAVADRHEPEDFHPLGAYVHRREVIELVAWPLSGRTPAGLPRRRYGAARWPPCRKSPRPHATSYSIISGAGWSSCCRRARHVMMS